MNLFKKIGRIGGLFAPASARFAKAWEFFDDIGLALIAIAIGFSAVRLLHMPHEIALLLVFGFTSLTSIAYRKPIEKEIDKFILPVFVGIFAIFGFLGIFAGMPIHTPKIHDLVLGIFFGTWFFVWTTVVFFGSREMRRKRKRVELEQRAYKMLERTKPAS